MNNNKGTLIVISGPSGVGKGTVVDMLLKRLPGAVLSVSCTTRAPREGEKNGKSYFFISKETFLKMIDEGGFLEYSNHFENYYGTPRFFVEQKLAEGCDVILEIDVDGAKHIRDAFPDALLLMITPPSREELVRRLRLRGTEDEVLIEKRLQRADYEMSRSQFYDYTVINDDLEQTVENILKILENRRKQTK
ncbi:MAG TPA: guanylate kinase [Candidatus Coproplasma avicola]|uniref:Guanylate kinase n=1 Tax=Candidatus Coproplasma avicola TaxID=2840744 RepID=A0A9D1E768_9FIRM|nr:guanylate kinase [Candidatus Coproplasma avicola]